MNVWSPKLERIVHFKARGVPLWVIGICGLVGVLVDIDHPIAYWVTGKTTRADHIPLAIISCLILCGVSACIGGLYCKLVLRGEKGTVPTFIKAQVISWSIVIAIIILVFWIFTLLK
jgi:uncharacterized membrane protein